MSPDLVALTHPDRPAACLGGSGEILRFDLLAQRSMHLARCMAEAGLSAGDHVAVMLENRLAYFEICWAAHRMGLFYTPVNWHLQQAEVAHILEDSGARWLFVSSAFEPWVRAAESTTLERTVVVGGLGTDSYAALLARAPTAPSPSEFEGQAMYYSSGTTGRPKGIKRALARTGFGRAPAWEDMIAQQFGIDEHTVYLCPAPLYHVAPLGWSMLVQRRGGQVVLMDRFAPLDALRMIQQYRVTHVQMVPTHFVQMLKLTGAERACFDVRSLRVSVHAAAPCPVEVKERMLDWWGPILHEFYSFSEGSGFTHIAPDEWLSHRGSVGRAPIGRIHILDEEGNELPPGKAGVVWFSGGSDFEYHNDPAKTAAAHDAQGRTTVGDMGYLDAEGYLYLTDRVSHLIISGGVNIYPQEVENLLVMHPEVSDVAVIGVPDAEYGERVLAVVVPAVADGGGPDLESRLIAYCREHLAHFKCPRQVVFASSLPRLPTGKLLKRQLKEHYIKASA